MYLKEDDITDIGRISEYNADYKKMYPDFKPFVTKENFSTFLKEVRDKKKGIGNNGVRKYFILQLRMIKL